MPILYSNGIDVFRLPKELAFRAEAIALLAAATFWATASRRTWVVRAQPVLIVVAAIVGWTAVTAAFSTNRALSADTLITVVAAAVIFIAALVAAQTKSMAAVDIVMIGACANAAVVILQELGIWTPFTYDIPESHYRSVGLLGNANDVGMFLAAPALAALVVALTARGLRRWIYAAICVLLVAGIAASATRTAVVALVAGLIVLAVRHSRGAAVASAGIVVVLLLLAISPRTSLGERAHELTRALAERNYELVFSERLLPFLAAIDMTRDHPLLGAGPGCFRFQFMRYRIALEGHYPERWTRGFPGNWGAVHNDHLQIAAESGVPGYALFLAAIGVGWGWRPRATAARDLETSFARMLRAPLVALIFVLCLAQFPLELAAPRLMLLTLGAFCITWSEGDAA